MTPVDRTSHNERVLAWLKAAPGQWVGGLYRLTGGCIVHSRISDLRAKGYIIECQRFAQDDWRYRLMGQRERAA